MYPTSFEYVAPRSVGEAIELLTRHGEDAKLLAGGQSLVPMMAMRLVRPAWLVDINEIAALKFIRVERDAARVGAILTGLELGGWARQLGGQRWIAVGARSEGA